MNLIKPLGLPMTVRKALVELNKNGLVLKYSKQPGRKCIELDSKTGNIVNKIRSSSEKSYRDAVINLFEHRGNQSVQVATNKGIDVTCIPDAEFYRYKTYGGYVKNGEEKFPYYTKTLSNGQKIEIVTRQNWSGTSPVKIIYAKENSEGINQYRVFPSGDFVCCKDYTRERPLSDVYFIPTKLGRTLSKVLRALVAPFKSNDEKELLELTLNLKGKPFGKTIEM